MANYKKIILLVIVFLMFFNYIGIVQAKAAGAIALGTGLFGALEAKAVLLLLGHAGIVGLTAVAAIVLYNAFIKDYITEYRAKPDFYDSEKIVITQELMDFTENTFIDNMDYFYSDFVEYANIEYNNPLVDGDFDNGYAYCDTLQTTGIAITSDYWMDFIGLPSWENTATGEWEIYERTSMVVTVTLGYQYDENPEYFENAYINVADAVSANFKNGVASVNTGFFYEDGVYYNGHYFAMDSSLVTAFLQIKGVQTLNEVDYHISIEQSPYLDNYDIYGDLAFTNQNNLTVGKAYEIPATSAIVDYVNSVPDLIEIPLGGDTGDLSGITGILQSILSYLQGVLGGIKDGIMSIPLKLQENATNILEGIQSIPVTISEGITNITDSIMSIPLAFDNVNNFIDNLFVPGVAEIDFSCFLNINIKEKFPFCLPFDLYNSIQGLQAEPEIPSWEIPIKDSSIDIDFDIFTELATISRYFITLIYVISLIILTRQMLGG